MTDYMKLLAAFGSEYNPSALKPRMAGTFRDDYLLNLIDVYGVERNATEIGVPYDRIRGFEARYLNEKDRQSANVHELH